MHAGSMSARVPVVKVSHLRKVYGSTVAVADVSFEVFEGEIFGLIGPNGAGKTTTLECIEGIRRPDGGTTSVLGLDPRKHAAALQERVGVQLQEAQLQKRIRVREAIDLWSSLYRRSMVWALHRYVDRLGWATVAGREVGPDPVRNLEHHPRRRDQLTFMMRKISPRIMKVSPFFKHPPPFAPLAGGS